MTNRRTLLGLAGAAAMVLGISTAASAAEHEFNLQSFLPAQATIPHMIIDVWADKVEEASGGRIAITRYASMQLGGKPPELFDQVIDGLLDITWNVNGYTPGRFPSTEVFELPFMVTDAAAASAAYWQMMEKHMMDTEFKDMKVLGVWVHGPGVIHANKPVTAPADFNGMKIRGASRLVNALLEQLGATPVGMPVPAVPEALSKGVIDGTTIPWEVTRALKSSELVHNHTEFTGPMLYTVTFVLAMNWDSYNALPDDLKKVIDDNSGLGFSVFAGTTQASEDDPGRDAAIALGNNVITLDAEQSAAWAEAAAPVYDAWVADMNAKGIDGQALIDEAKALMANYK
ncbi:MAG: TRAP transporter substrate-binding protein [Antarcticimicrobium sp.]|uniref:TRAP transporter substrate-binding protein n=1 Tax=Antarcticimicrobium sp. TaxID=2824147 RepID=UPI00261BFD22|nr:TRAP transporter substrate-binding protein [Antarcticimicrobium sp.]MDF1717766.1 TRAP transporter substrate-binding protein [Antarcticimicrobium sp.]